MMEKVTNTNNTISRKKLKKRIFSRFGFCIEMKLERTMIFDISKVATNRFKDISIFITDNATQTYFGIDFSSQKGKQKLK